MVDKYRGVITHYSVWILAHSSVLCVTTREMWFFFYWFPEFYPVFLHSAYHVPTPKAFCSMSTAQGSPKKRGRASAGPDEVASGSVPHGDLTLFSYCIPNQHQPLPRDPYSANKSREPGLLSARTLTGQREQMKRNSSFFKESGSLRLPLIVFTGDVLGWRISCS